MVVSVYILSTPKEEPITIPDTSIRFRIIANSNSLEDQLEKNEIKQDLIKNVIPKMLNNNISSSRASIKNTMPLLKEQLNTYNIPYSLNLGQNYFPEKNYKGVTYDAGYYESLVITLGSGLGDNWWCVLYPPLCLIETEPNLDNITFKSYIKEYLDNSN